jgi:hypothetical protein
MLNIHHLEQSIQQKYGYTTTLDDLITDGTLIHCEDCGKLITKNWCKEKGFKNYPDQTKCGPCKDKI